jgi:hypothetical protein
VAEIQDQKLMDYFQFDEDDLQANRNGNFSEKQKNYSQTRAVPSSADAGRGRSFSAWGYSCG